MDLATVQKHIDNWLDALESVNNQIDTIKTTLDDKVVGTKYGWLFSTTEIKQTSDGLRYELTAAEKKELEKELGDLKNQHVAITLELSKWQDILEFGNNLGDLAAQERSKEMKAAMARILPTELVEKTGKSSVRKLEALRVREEAIEATKASVNADLEAARTLGFTGEVAE